MINSIPIISTVLFVICAIVVAKPLLAIWDRIALSYISDLSAMLAKLHVNPVVLTWTMRCWGMTVLTVIVFGFVLNIWPLAIAVAGILYVMPRIVLQYFVKRKRTLLRDQLVTSLSVMANSIRAGLSIEMAMEQAANETPEPLARELRRIIGEYNHGRPFVEAMDEAKQRLELPSFTLYASAVTTNKKRGGVITDTMERLRKSLIENQRLERKLEADTATGKMVINLLSLFPFIFMGFSYFANPTGTALMFGTFLGQLALVIVLILMFIGYRVGMKVMEIDF